MDLEECRLTFGESAGIDLETLPATLVRLDALAPARPLRRPDLDRPHPSVAARVDLVGGRSTWKAEGADWIVDPVGGDAWLGEITTSLEWTVDFPDADRLELTLGGLDGGKPRHTTLYPMGGAIRLFVFNIPAEQFPGIGEPKPAKKGAPAEHFDAYFPLVQAPPVRPHVRTPREPEVRVPDASKGSDCAERMKQDLADRGVESKEGRTPYTVTCLLARAEIEPV